MIIGVAGGGVGLLLLLLLGCSVCYCCPRPSDFIKKSVVGRSPSNLRTVPAVYCIGPEGEFKQI